MTGSAGIRGSVLALSVSEPRPVRMGDMEWSSSILKEPSSGPIVFAETGPVGNRPAVHPEAVYAISVESYEYWHDRLGVPRGAWNWGHWGENITFRGLLESELRVGDVLELSGGVVLQVSGPRHPCLKLAWRLGQPAGILHTLIESGVLGFYLRVLKPGSIAAGETVTVTSPFPSNRLIIDLPRLMHDASAKPEELRAAIDMPGLSEYPKIFLRQRLSQALDDEISRDHRWSGWRNFLVAKIVQEAQSITSFHLVPADGKPLAGYRPGQFVSVEVPLDGESVTRQWSLSDYALAPTEYRISVKAIAKGTASAWMHTHVAVGSQLRVRAPAGRFVLDTGTPKPIVLISAGIGVTPLLAMLKAHASRRSGKTPHIVWIHGARDGSSHAFRQETRHVLAQLQSVQEHVFYSAPRPDDRLGIDYHVQGRITPEAVQRLVQTVHVQLAGKGSAIPGQICEFYICGPQAMQRELRDSLIQWGVEEHTIRSESFVPPAKKVLGTGVSSAAVLFSRTGAQTEWQADAGDSLLTIAESLGVEISNSCRSGMCHACVCRVIRGAVTHTVEVEGVPAGWALLCSSVPASAELELDA